MKIEEAMLEIQAGLENQSFERRLAAVETAGDLLYLKAIKREMALDLAHTLWQEFLKETSDELQEALLNSLNFGFNQYRFDEGIPPLHKVLKSTTQYSTNVLHQLIPLIARSRDGSKRSYLSSLANHPNAEIVELAKEFLNI